MQVFDQIRTGRFRLYSAAMPEFLDSILDAWKKNLLGQIYVIKPIVDQVIGEEVINGQGQIVAVFGFSSTNAFTPDVDVQQKYLGKLSQIVQQVS